ncbi:hypothetical protein TPHA_0H02170 [Tetrapisispora phaffii CBS 4417]|uniref:SPX domain-containing protein n=1 Tax=Tetrapisispora phaffii (strain ATCC 24235 / CBS 4417 / NBRC 1672 / NRRL Y-8282 / UCD 70-5) TaxID=1071381 RepID=G8BWH0_TETPH|nr:hypothetical protein TPHA_0H02170 [Tetrapisispora phaffii CBS 4417]CCE64421.1 hypothetical protein TPHA_0H02170 [Tetrapisispora phaffii CBS 4417]
MKFSHSLQFNAVPDWSSKYIAYSQLKKTIYALQKDKLYNSSNITDLENDGLSPDNDHNTSDDIYINKFIKELNAQLQKIDGFYINQEKTLIDNFNDILQEINEFDEYYLSDALVCSHLNSGVIQNANEIENEPSNDDETSSLIIHRNLSLQNDRNYSSIGENKRNFSGGGNLLDNNTIDGVDDTVKKFLPLKNSISNSVLDDNNRKISYGKIRKTSMTNSINNMVMDNNIYIEHKITIKKRLISIFTQFNELLDYINLNLTGFTKICKKFDKSLETNIKTTYLSLITKKSHCFNDITINRVKVIINRIIIMFAKFSNSIPQESSILLFSSDDSYDTSDNNAGIQDYTNEEANEEVEKSELFMNAKRQLSSHLRDHIIWERNTVWKDMINLERKANNVNNDTNASYFNNLYTSFNIKNNLKKDFEKLKGNDGFNNATSITDIIQLRTFVHFMILTLIFIFFLIISPFQEDILQKNCFAILIYASLLWATETIPLFVTSLLVPLLIVMFPVLSDPTDPGTILTPVQSSQYILSTMWSSVIMLLLGGFTLAAALSKYNIAKVIATKILSSVGTNPKIILITMMFLALFISMWVSNVAAPVICFSIIQPILRTLPKQSSYGKSLIMGIALASNIGGMASPISSPQNIFAISLMDPQPTWIEWFAIAIPICILCIVIIWILLIITFPLDPNLKILQLHPIRESFSHKQWAVCGISMLTILLWCFSNQISSYFGEMGIISIIPLVLFFGTGLLTSEDFNSFMWTIIILAMGGTTLGKAVSLSGLLSHVAEIIKAQVEHDTIFTIVLIFGLLILTIATFVSHVVAAMIVLPLMSEIGSSLPSDHSRLLVMMATMLCSCAMGLPTSGIPNVTAISLTDEFGDRYLTVGNFITRGVPSGFLCYFIIVTVGFGLMKLIGF